MKNKTKLSALLECIVHSNINIFMIIEKDKDTTPANNFLISSKALCYTHV